MEQDYICLKCKRHIHGLPYLSEVDNETIICRECYEKEKYPENSMKIDTYKKILLVEDGSVDVEKLEADGFYVIPYRQGSQPPMWL